MKVLPIYPDHPEMAVEQTAPLDADPNCERCSLHKGVRTVCMAPELTGVDPDSAEVLYVHGSLPGEAEDRVGRPNVGALGKYLRGILDKHWKGAVVFDHALRCAPGARKLTPKMVDSCRPYVAATLAEAKPKRILCLGGTAVNSILGRAFPPLSVRKGYGYTAAGVPVFFLANPAQGLRNRFHRQAFEEDLLWALTANPPGLPTGEWEDGGAACFLIETEADARAALAVLLAKPSVTWDLETFGAPFNDEFEVLNLALTPEGGHFSYVLDKKALDNPKVGPLFFRFLEKHPSGGTNIKYDVVGLRARYGVVVRNIVHDTGIWRKLLESACMSRLEYQQALVGFAGAKDEIKPFKAAGAKQLRACVKKPATEVTLFPNLSPTHIALAVEKLEAGDDVEKYSYAAIPEQERALYNARDTLSTDRVRAYLETRFDERPDLRRVWTEVSGPLARALTEMECNGVAVDRQMVDSLSAEMGTIIDEIRLRLDEFGTDFNPNSQPMVGKLLFETLGLQHQGLTQTGKYSCTAEVLGSLSHPVAKDIVDYKRASHFKSQYADGMRLHIRDDGRIHSNFKVAGTETGRPSCEQPNLFNIPSAKTPEGKMARDIFIAEPGCVLLESDYSQVELRVASMLSGDEVMIELFQAELDFHLETAKMIAPLFKIDPAAVTKEHILRDQAKTINFATLYGEPAMALAAKLGITRVKAQALQDAILGKFKKLKAWLDSRLRFARGSGHCRTWWAGEDARERPLWEIAEPDEKRRATSERSSWNTPIQGTAAEYTNASLGAINDWLIESGTPAKLVLTVYDSIVLEVRADVLPAVGAKVKSIMESWPVLHGVPILSEMKLGKSWGSMESWHP